MTSESTEPCRAHRTGRARRRGERRAVPAPGCSEHSELGVCVLLFALGVLVLADALTMSVDIAQRGPVGPRTVPFVIGGMFLLIAVLLAVDVLRGGRGEAEGGEDVDLDEPADWRTVLLLTGVFLGAAVLIGPLGFPVAGALLFWGPPTRWAAAATTAIRSSRPGSPSSPTSSSTTCSVSPSGRPADGGALTDGFPQLPHRRLRYRAHPDEPAVGRDRRPARHGDRRAPRHRTRDGRGAAAPGDVRTGPDRRVHHVRGHLLRGDVRRLHHLDPPQHPR